MIIVMRAMFVARVRGNHMCVVIHIEKVRSEYAEVIVFCAMEERLTTGARVDRFF